MNPSTEAEPRSRVRMGWRRAVPLAASAMIWGAVVMVYLARPDAWAAATIFPLWCWLFAGIFLAVLGIRRRGNAKVAWIVAAWLAAEIGLSEEPWSLLRGLRPRPPAQTSGAMIRVVSLNCAIGNQDAAREVAAFQPDIVLLQESPNREEVTALAKRLFGDDAGVVHGVEASILARGKVEAVVLPGTLRGYFTEARVRLADGREIEVISTRLTPGLFRMDLWSPDCWTEQAENRRVRRRQMGEIAKSIKNKSLPVIVGGDFNAPQSDAVFRLLSPKLHDSFAEAGRGWGNTFHNDYPVLRIDQIWVSDHFRASSVVARKTRHSDHRMVICDLIFRDRLR